MQIGGPMQEVQPRLVHVHGSTDRYPDERHLSIWPERPASGAAHVVEPSDDPVHAEVTCTLLSSVAIVCGPRSASHYRVSRELLKNCRDVVAISISQSGEALATQIQISQELIGGGASVLPGADASGCTLTDDGALMTLALARPAIAELAPDFEAALGRTIPADDPALRLLVRYLDAVIAADELAHPEVARSVATHVLDLAALVLGARSRGAQAAAGGTKAARLKALKADVISMLGDCELSSEMIASRHSISSRYVRKLFEQEGTSFTSFVLAERLARVRRMLGEIRYAHLTIAQTAHACGFNDISYFNRAFRRHFGATPTDVRENKGET